jgi:hypothetical protein
MADRSPRNVSLPPIAVLAAAALAVLKLTHGISWSWWWVLSPLWAMAAIVLLIFAGILVTAAIDNWVNRTDRADAPASSPRRRRFLRAGSAKRLPPQSGI